MSRLIVAMGGKADTVRGLSGLGDLVLTATSHQSRNLRFGIALGRGEGKDMSGGLVEGAFAAAVAARLGEVTPSTCRLLKRWLPSSTEIWMWRAPCNN